MTFGHLCLKVHSICLGSSLEGWLGAGTGDKGAWVPGTCWKDTEGNLACECSEASEGAERLAQEDGEAEEGWGLGWGHAQ